MAAVNLWGKARRQGAILDNMPLVDTLHHAISLPGIDDALAAKAIEAVAVTASSYTSGVHWTFCQTAAAGRLTLVEMNPPEVPLHACRPAIGLLKLLLMELV